MFFNNVNEQCQSLIKYQWFIEDKKQNPKENYEIYSNSSNDSK